jgi:hypothetical protein
MSDGCCCKGVCSAMRTSSRRHVRSRSLFPTVCHAPSPRSGPSRAMRLHALACRFPSATSRTSARWPPQGPAAIAGLRADTDATPAVDRNDLKHFLAVARNGSTLAAAKALGTSQSTVHRRLQELEKRLGRSLIKRHPTGYRLTELGGALYRLTVLRVGAFAADLGAPLHRLPPGLTGPS